MYISTIKFINHLDNDYVMTFRTTEKNPYVLYGSLSKRVMVLSAGTWLLEDCAGIEHTADSQRFAHGEHLWSFSLSNI